MPIRECINCGNEFFANTCGKLCSDACKIVHNQKEGKKYRSENKEVIQSYFRSRHRDRYTPKGRFCEDSSCSFCGTSFVKLSHNGAYCSKDCAIKSKKEQVKLRKNIYNKVCEVCCCNFNTANNRTVCCSEVCKKEKIKKSKRINSTAICIVCSKQFNKTSTALTCSTACSRLHRINHKRALNKLDYVRYRENKRRRENPKWGVKGELKRKLGFEPDQETVDLAVMRLELRRAIRKAEE